MRRLLPTIAVVMALGAPILGRDLTVPDISGTWVLNLTKSKLAKGTNVHSETVVITSSESNIVMHFNTDGNESTHAYIADGKERVFAKVQGGEDLVKAYWKKSTLVIETFARLKMPNMPAVDGSEAWHLKARWTLSGDGRVLTDEVEGFDAKTVSVYDKQ